MPEAIPGPLADEDAPEQQPAPAGHNNPPPFDPKEVEALSGEANGFLDTAGKWIEAGDIKSEANAQRLNDFIAGVRKRKTHTDNARKEAKKPHDDAGKAVQAAYTPIITKLECAISKVQPLATKWLEKKDEEARQEAARKAEEARRQREEAERLAAQAEQRHDVSGEVDAEAAKKAADQAEKDAARAAKQSAKVSSATGGTRSMGLRTNREAKIVNMRSLFFHYADHPKVAECLKSLADADIRAKDVDEAKIPGIEIVETRRAV